MKITLDGFGTRKQMDQWVQWYLEKGDNLVNEYSESRDELTDDETEKLNNGEDIRESLIQQFLLTIKQVAIT